MRILVINTTPFTYQGIACVIRNYCYRIKSPGLQIEYAVFDLHPELEKELKQSGLVYYRLASRRTHSKIYFKQLKLLLKNGHFDCVHIHGNSAMMLPELVLAKNCGIEKRIVHCHNTTCNNPLLNSLLLPLFYRLSTIRLACSEEAGNWLYKGRSYTVLNNAIDTEVFRFDELKRNLNRKKLGLENQFVIGHIGRINEQKNHEYLVRVFKEFHDHVPDSKLICIGEGALRPELEQLISDLKLEEHVMLLGEHKNVENLLNAMDCFVFPSKWEGLGMVLLEAQAGGLPCIASDAVPNEADMGLTRYLPLGDTACWCRAIEDIKNREQNRCKTSEQCRKTLKQKSYDLNENIKQLVNIYLDVSHAGT